ncbi:Putative stress-induced transcription regulator [Paenibacillus sophorae]|uniref:CGNR zinc finger domain-containing protein n=1 Tax=Paenibacillus sophorae TaxID=1333845 RepID=A0A1H8KES4_9BACL|nr:CGNR zinc finger domain-containing protein [Paenibacillus sophorae]QWU13723.1 CGNR zinc finger domain-containing protein [Paenibacillus sophorae]SEN91374.1 Putative stress-induced transcription regulator [Paenibacillus sophorae]
MAVQEKFQFLSNSLSLNLVNTEENRRGKRHDLLETGQQVYNWLEHMFSEQVIHAEQFSQNNHVNFPQESLSALKELRGLLRKGFEDIVDRQLVDEHWIHSLERYIHNAPFTFVIKENKLLPIPCGPYENALFSLIAYDALELLANGKLAILHRCSNPKCLWMFMDATGKRKWCSMKICGNRMKVARHQYRS